MNKKYTAADFKSERFAEHPNPEDVHARFAARMNTDPAYPWLLDGVPGNTDASMARYGWVPVPTKPQITESRYREIRDDNYATGGGLRDAFESAGIEIIPDSEPTNTERLEALIKEVQGVNYGWIAAHLDKHGVTAPNVKGN